MIRVRATNGKILEVDEHYSFVEVCDMDGRVACVVYTDSTGVLHIAEAGSQEADRYKHAFKVDFIPVKSLQ